MIPSSRPQLSDLYTLSQSKLLENHTFHSGTYLYSPYMAVPSGPPPPPTEISPSGPKEQGLPQLVSTRPSRGEVPSSIPRRDLKSLFGLLMNRRGNILYESTVDLSFFQWDGWVPKLSSKERLNCPLVAQNDYEREIFVAGVHAWHLTKIARAHGLIRGQSGTSFWKRFCTWILRMCSARWSKNMADEEDDDPVVAEVCLSHDCEDLCTV